MAEATNTKPVPAPTEQERPYWDEAREHRLTFPACVACGWMTAQPVLVCSRCRGEDFTWRQVSGRGSVHASAIANKTTTRGFENEVPYVVALVSIAEQPDLLVTTNLLGDGIAERDIAIGEPVVVDFEDRGTHTVPQFRLVD